MLYILSCTVSLKSYLHFHITPCAMQLTYEACSAVPRPAPPVRGSERNGSSGKIQSTQPLPKPRTYLLIQTLPFLRFSYMRRHTSYCKQAIWCAECATAG